MNNQLIRKLTLNKEYCEKFVEIQTELELLKQDLIFNISQQLCTSLNTDINTVVENYLKSKGVKELNLSENNKDYIFKFIFTSSKQPNIESKITFNIEKQNSNPVTEKTIDLKNDILNKRLLR